MVLKGGVNTTSALLPIIIPGLQNRSVISVVSGENHFGALTSCGKLLTWSEYSKGLRSEVRKPPPDIMIPSEMRFDNGLEAERKVKRYCFGVAACRDHTAALVVDLAEDEAPPEDL